MKSGSLLIRGALLYEAVGIALQLAHGASILNPLTYLAAVLWLPGLVFWVGGLLTKLALFGLVVAAGVLAVMLLRQRLGNTAAAKD